MDINFVQSYLLFVLLFKTKTCGNITTCCFVLLIKADNIHYVACCCLWWIFSWMYLYVRYQCLVYQDSQHYETIQHNMHVYNHKIHAMALSNKKVVEINISSSPDGCSCLCRKCVQENKVVDKWHIGIKCCMKCVDKQNAMLIVFTDMHSSLAHCTIRFCQGLHISLMALHYLILITIHK